MLYNWHRDYNPSLGRYDQFDPTGLRGGINGYGYVGANPLTYADPGGLQAAVPTPMGPLPLPLPVPQLNPLPKPVDPTDPFGPQFTPMPSTPSWWSSIKNAYHDWCEREECKDKCVAQHDRDAEECGVAKAFWGLRGYADCMRRAGDYLGQCMRACDGK